MRDARAAAAGEHERHRAHLTDLCRRVAPVWSYEYNYSNHHNWAAAQGDAILSLADLPNELLLHILSFLDVSDLLATSRVSG